MNHIQFKNICFAISAILSAAGAWAECLPGKTTVKFPMNYGLPQLADPEAKVTVPVPQDCEISSVRGVERSDNVWLTNEYTAPISCWKYPLIRVVGRNQFCLENSQALCKFDYSSPNGNAFKDNIGACEYEVIYGPKGFQPVKKIEKTEEQIRLESAYVSQWIVPARSEAENSKMDFVWIMDDSASMALLQRKIETPLKNQLSKILDQRSNTARDWVITTRGRLLLSSLQGDAKSKKTKILAALLESTPQNGGQTEKTFPQIINFLSRKTEETPLSIVIISDENEQSNKSIQDMSNALLEASAKYPINLIFMVNQRKFSKDGKDTTHSQRYRDLHDVLKQQTFAEHMLKIQMVDLPENVETASIATFESLFTNALNQKALSNQDVVAPFKSQYMAGILQITVNGKPLDPKVLEKIKSQTKLTFAKGTVNPGDVIEIFFEK